MVEISLAPRPSNTSSRLVKIMMMGIELGQPRYHDGGEATAAHDRGGEGVVRAGQRAADPRGRIRAPESTMVRTMTRSTLMPA